MVNGGRAKKKKAHHPLREPKTDTEVDRAVGKAVSILMQRGVRECLRQKLPSTIVLMAAGEMAGLTASMMGLPYAQALQAACNGVQTSYVRTGNAPDAAGPAAAAPSAGLASTVANLPQTVVQAPSGAPPPAAPPPAQPAAPGASAAPSPGVQRLWASVQREGKTYAVKFADGRSVDARNKPDALVAAAELRAGVDGQNPECYFARWEGPDRICVARLPA